MIATLPRCRHYRTLLSMSQMIREMSSKNGAYKVLKTTPKPPHILSQQPTCLFESTFSRRSHTPTLKLPLQAVPRQAALDLIPTASLLIDTASQNGPTRIKAPPSRPHFDQADTTTLLPYQTSTSSRASTSMVVRYQSVGPSSTSTQEIPTSHLQVVKSDSNHAWCKGMTVS